MGRHAESGAALPQLQCARGDGVSVRSGEAAELDVRNPSGRRGEATALDVRRPSGTNPLRFFSVYAYIYTAVSAPAIFFTVTVLATYFCVSAPKRRP